MGCTDTTDDPDDVYPASRAVRLAARRGDLAAAAAAFAELRAFPRCSKAYVAGDLIMTFEAALLAGIPEADVARHGGPLPDPHRVPRPRRGARGCRRRRAWPGTTTSSGCSRGVSTRWAPSYPIPYRASLHLYLARALAAHSRLADARVEATTARRMLERWPGWRRDSVDALLQRLDGAVAPSGDGDGALTRRELEVAALLAEGLSNADVARRLFISPKTAAVHVSNILMKLGMSSRSEVAAWHVQGHPNATSSSPARLMRPSACSDRQPRSGK